MRSARHHLGLAVAALLAGALLLCAAVPAARAQDETEHEEEFSYVAGDENGPEHWGEIKAEWAACGAGRMQSPIDLSHGGVSLSRSLGYLDHSYRPAQASVVNRGHDIMLRFDGDAGSLVINGTAYRLTQLHWHSPAEHTVDGRRYDLELHLVHESAEKKNAVIAVLYEIGGHDALLHQLEPFIRRVANQRDREERVGLVNPMAARGRASVYYRYMGSLTAPPCTEGVIWTIIKRVRTVSKYQLELLRDAVQDAASAAEQQRPDSMHPARRHLRLVFAALLAGALLLCAAAVPAAGAQEEKFGYVTGDEHGPQHWGAIKAEWAACGAGRMQSPVDLSHGGVSLSRSLGYLDHSYRPAQASVVNRGHDIMLRFDGDAGSLVINGTAYRLTQVHWHSPTEHTVDGRRYDLELHLVHESAEKKNAVIAILYEIGGGHDALLHQLEPFIRRVANQRDREERVGLVNPMAARGRASIYYRYMGSLTAPPCTEGVVWTIIKRVHTTPYRSGLCCLITSSQFSSCYDCGHRLRRGLALLAAAALLLLSGAAVRAQEETEDEHEFSYVPGDEHGPAHWGEIKPEWAACGAGRMQSPIDLSHDRVSLVRSLGYLRDSYRPAQASIVNRGHDIMVRFSGDAGSVWINGTSYALKQMHWHSPSEHTVGGRRRAMELHLVHESAAGKAAVVGVLYDVGERGDALLSALEPAIRRIADRGDHEEDVGVVDPRGARGTASVYYRYMGSLTTPPCTEGVIWTIVKRVRSVSKDQLELLREAVHDDMENNARPLQEVNGRDISMFRPNKPHTKHY
ncbi:hypothetical protein U9M48_038594 [Paspalum notatum var. saurae]|uniref:Alpha-carbonic anhydrase domain-containing protein n=1 Tax=Paspalum notatum var. saurae TaxID=547442 RepID=A0AAQ3UJL5_PASNO